MARTTPLHQVHIESGARMVDFGGWDMPIHYGSQLEEHHQVRRAAGMFDVSHMTVVDLEGERCRPFLSYLLANDVARLQEPGKALYSCMLREDGGVIDDLIAYFIDESHFRLVVNAATRDKDLEWITEQAGEFEVTVSERTGLAMIAVQGPEAREKTAGVLGGETAEAALALGPFHSCQVGDLFVARTGYTGEDGFEMTLPGQRAPDLWQRLQDAGVAPCGLGARDTLRLEAGMNLYGQDMDESVSPLESGLAWTVAMKDERMFIGRRALEAQKEQGLERKLTGLLLLDKGVLRPGMKVVTDKGDGELTSGGFAPTLERSIGFARVPASVEGECQVDIRGRLLKAKFVRPPFVRAGNVCSGVL
ncbi:MAG: glycine cleavage system aminomethyltransferase GcvT [Xanthomonadales bacterium]|nr:glycine cleavage system aminomethyltransferase GcvT [Xanthomonadales bacterium]